MIVVDNRGNEFLDFIPVDETNAEGQYEPITHCLAVVKIEDDYLMGWNKWRQEWEIFGGCREDKETLKEVIRVEKNQNYGIYDPSVFYNGR